MQTTEHVVPTALDLTYIRAQFPSLAQTVNGHPAAFLDGPGGTQVPQRVIDAISNYLRRDNANTGGAYATSRHTDAVIAEARSRVGRLPALRRGRSRLRPQHDDPDLCNVPRNRP
jgi:selenocysteine lyase/cysteine desulfurase